VFVGWLHLELFCFELAPPREAMNGASWMRLTNEGLICRQLFPFI
jgi:hypothetical protein